MDPVLDVLCRQLAVAIAEKTGTDPNPANTLPQVYQRIADHLRSLDGVGVRAAHPPEAIALTPELREWAKGQFTDEELAAGIREIRETGGLTFDDVIRGLEPPATRD
jgi:hypothetical protein